MSLELVIFIGLPASGKSTFYRQRFADSHVLVSKDLMPNNRNPNRRQQQLIAEALAAGKSVVIDNTNPRAADREPLIALARKAGATIAGYYFSTSASDSLQRNARRTGKSRVPPVAIFTAVKRMERPAYREGFHNLYYVTLHENHTFHVAPWQQEDQEESPSNEI